MAKAKTAAKKTPAKLGPKGRPLSTIRLVLEATKESSPGGLLQFLQTLNPSKREQVTEAQVFAGGNFRIIVETPSSETRDIDEAIRALPPAVQSRVTHASRVPVTA